MDGSFAALFHQAAWTVLRAALPILGAAMAVGLVIGILQTATSIQEQTLSFVPKILAVILTALFLGPLVFRPVLRLAVEVFGRLHTYIQ
ncbi:MAG TPA: flagellar biosynthetic protein FliQ [Synergistales bacterium]|jgi:flagellar biosynthetic protein FliQ|nr:flagellar biosynthetic protein FliQ [Synergistales bacterium]